MFFIVYALKGQVTSENCKSLVLPVKCNIEIFLSPACSIIRFSLPNKNATLHIGIQYCSQNTHVIIPPFFAHNIHIHLKPSLSLHIYNEYTNSLEGDFLSRVP